MDLGVAAHALSNWVFLEVLEYLGTFSFWWAVIFYFADAPNAPGRSITAWQVINTARARAAAEADRGSARS